MRWFVAVAGTVLLVVGILGAVRGWPTAGVALTLFFAVVFFLLVLVADRIEGVDLRAGEQRLGLKLSPAEPIQELDEVGLKGAAAIYAFIHNQLANDGSSRDVKVQLQDRLVELVKQNGFVKPVDGDRVAQSM